MAKNFQVYKQEFKFKVSYFVLTEVEASSGSYILRGTKYIGRIHAVSKGNATSLLKELLAGALSKLDK